MKKYFTLLFLSMMATAAMAVDITFIAGVDNGNGSTTAAPFSIKKEGITIDVSNGMANDNHYRIYKGQTATVTSMAGLITQIVWYCVNDGDSQYGPGCFTVSDGDYTYAGKTGTWNGQASSVVFTAKTYQVRATKIVVTIDETTMSRPVISPPSGTYYEPVQVSISSLCDYSHIFYTLDGTEPTAASILYTEPFVVSESTTVKAVTLKEEDLSEVTTATYEIQTATAVASISEYKEVPDGTLLQFTNPVSVLYQNNNNLYVKDETGFAFFYGNCGRTYRNGDVIPPGFVGVKTTYCGQTELKDLKNFKPATDNRPIPATVITIDELTPEMFGNYLRFEDVTLKMNEDGRHGTMTDSEGNSCPIYFGPLMSYAPDPINNLHFNVEGIFAYYTIQSNQAVMAVLPTKVETVSLPPVVITPSQVGPQTHGMTVRINQVFFSGNKIVNIDDEECYCEVNCNPILPAVLYWSYNVYGTVEYSAGDLVEGPHYYVNITNYSGNSNTNDIADVASLRSLYKLTDDDDLSHYFHLTGHFTRPLTAVYQYADHLYVRDINGQYGLVDGYVSGIFSNGDIIEGAIAKSNRGSGWHTIAPVKPESFVITGHGTYVNPEQASINALNLHTEHNYLAFECVTIQDGIMSDQTGSIRIDNAFDVELPKPRKATLPYEISGEVSIADINFVIDVILNEKQTEWDGTYDVEGFLNERHSDLELRPTKITCHGNPVDYFSAADANNDGEVNLADINYIINVILSH